MHNNRPPVFGEDTCTQKKSEFQFSEDMCMPNNRPTVFWEDARVENNGFGKREEGKAHLDLDLPVPQRVHL